MCHPHGLRAPGTGRARSGVPGAAAVGGSLGGALAGSYGIDDSTARVAELLQAAFETEALQSYPVSTAAAPTTTTAQALPPFPRFLLRFFHVFSWLSARASWIPGVQTVKMGGKWRKIV